MLKKCYSRHAVMIKQNNKNSSDNVFYTVLINKQCNSLVLSLA